MGFKELDYVKKRFLRYLAFKCGIRINHTDHDYKNFSSLADISTVKSFHHINDLLIFSDLISYRTDDKNLTDKLKIRNLSYMI